MKFETVTARARAVMRTEEGDLHKFYTRVVKLAGLYGKSFTN